MELITGVEVKKCLIALIAAAFLTGASQSSKALPQETVVAGSASSVGAVAYIGGTIIGVAAFLCIYDLYLKASGLKKWDGTPIKGRTPRFP